MRGLDTAVGHQKGGFELLKQFVVDLRTGKQLAQWGIERGAGAGEAGFEPLGPGWFGCDGRVGGFVLFQETKHGQECLSRLRARYDARRRF